MKEYIKPYIEDEDIELEDVIASSQISLDEEDGDIDNVFPGIK